MKARRLAGLIAAAALALPGAARATELHLVLPLRTDQTGLTRMAEAVSNPVSPDYRHYASVAWLSARFGASAATRRRVTTYLGAHGATRIRVDATGQFVYADMTPAAAAHLFSVSLHRARGPHDERFTQASGAVTLPRALRGQVTGVIGLDTAPVAAAPLADTVSDPVATPAAAPLDTTAPTTTTPTPTTTTAPTTTTPTTTTPTTTTPGSTSTPGIPSGYPSSELTATPTGCPQGSGTGGFTPNEYLDAYGYAPLQQSGLLGQGERVALIEIDGFNAADIDQFASCFGLPSPHIRALGIGSIRRALPAGGEATLDLEVLDAAAPDLKSIDVYETQADAASVLRAITAPLQKGNALPDVISVSLGLCETQTLSAAGRSAINASETALKVAAAAGVSVLGASGDFGSAGCSSLASTSLTPLPELAITYPASSPWVTAVGGTNITLNAQNQLTGQAVWNDGSVVPGEAAGGGFSILFARPSWQAGVVSGTSRAIPDVGLLADVGPGYAVYCTAQSECRSTGWQTFGGTSAATPLMAGGFALIDQLLREQGHQALGFADPLLYQLGDNPATAAQVFDDVTVGSNDVGPYIQASAQPLGCCSAAAGYDEASGWGGVNLQALSQAALTDQPLISQVALRVLHPQRAAAGGGIYVHVTCSSACDMGAYARVVVTGARTFTDYAKLTPVTAAGTRRLKVTFTAAQIRTIEAALHGGGRASATVVGTVLDAAGDILRHTAPRHLPIIG